MVTDVGDNSIFVLGYRSLTKCIYMQTNLIPNTAFILSLVLFFRITDFPKFFLIISIPKIS